MTTTAQTLTSKLYKAYPFTVDKFPMTGPDSMATPHYGLFRSDNSKCVGNAVRKGYEPHTVDDCAAMIEAAAEAFGSDPNNVDITCGWNDGHQIVVQPSREFRKVIFDRTHGTAGQYKNFSGNAAGMKQDAVWARIIISAGYDGKPFVGSLGAHRDLCNNLAIVQDAGMGVSRRIKHTGKLRARIADLVETFRELATQWNNVTDTIMAMDQRRVDLAAFIREVYPLPEVLTNTIKTKYEARLTSIVGRIMRERVAVGRPDLGFNLATAWEAFNGVQGYVQHDKTRRGNVTVFDRSFNALSDATVATALQLALAS